MLATNFNVLRRFAILSARTAGSSSRGHAGGRFSDAQKNLLVLVTCRAGSWADPNRGRYFPNPVSETTCGLPPPSSVMLKLAVRYPLTLGVKVTVIVQDPPGGMGL